MRKSDEELYLDREEATPVINKNSRNERMRSESSRSERTRREKRQNRKRMQEERRQAQQGYGVDEFDASRDSKRRTRRRTRKSKKQVILTNVLIVIFALVFVVSAYQLYSIYAEYKAGDDVYEELLDKYVSDTVPEESEEEQEGQVEGYATFYVDFDALKEVNPDIVAWIRFEQPEIINYPVVQGDDNATYLSMGFTGEYNSLGTLFVDADNSGDFTDDNTIIYGHNMKNGSMFGDLSDYIEEVFYQEYSYFYIYTPDGKASKYQIAIVSEVSETDSYRYTVNFDSAIEFTEYILDIYKTSYYDTSAQMDSSDNLITLSTCTAADDRRFIVQAVKVEELDVVVPD